MIPFSKRLSWHSQPNALSELTREVRASGREVLDLTVSNPTRVLADYPHGAIARALGAIPDFNYAPDPFGLLETRRAIEPVCADRVFLSASSSEAYSVLFKVLCDPGDEVLIPTPSYPLFDYLAGLDDVRTVAYHLRYDGSWFIDFETLQISDRTRAIVVVSPNNPTGSYVKQFEIDRLCSIAAQHGLALIVDEVFAEYPLEVKTVPVRYSADALTFRLDGLSKRAAMPQMKVGWCVFDGPEAAVAAARSRLEITLDTYLSVATPVQRAAAGFLRIGGELRCELQHRTSQNLNTAKTLLHGSAANCLHTEGGWSVIVRLPETQTDEQWCLALMEQHGVLLQPGYFFDLQGAHVVASLITEPRIFKAGIQRLADTVAQFCPQ